APQTPPKTTPGEAPMTHAVWVFVDDLDTHFAHASAAGATIVSPIRRHGYRAYEAADLDGHRWTFAQARPAMGGMGVAGGESWRIRTSQGRDNLDLALWVRAAERIEAAGALVPGPLDIDPLPPPSPSDLTGHQASQRADEMAE